MRLAITLDILILDGMVMLMTMAPAIWVIKAAGVITEINFASME
jgi:hypothetical protein